MEVENFSGSSYTGSKDFSQHDVPKANANGFGAAADDYMERGIDLNEQLIKNKPATFFMRANTGSMVGAGISAGDILIVDKSVRPTNGRIVIAVVDGEMLIRRYEQINNTIILTADAPGIAAIDVSRVNDFKIWGVIMWVMKMMQDTNLIHKKNSNMPFIKIWVHLVWATKERSPLLTDGIRQNVFSHIRENAVSNGIYAEFVNGHKDHVHCLVSLNQEQTIAKVVQLLKGESSFWINKNKLCKEKFEWQDEYFAVSVSESGVNAVRAYIKNQEEHHSRKDFAEEYNELINKYGFKRVAG